MKDELFQQLAASLKEGGAILRGKKKPARSTTLQLPDAKAVREKLGLSQNQFAALIGISPRTHKATAVPKAPPAPSSASPNPTPKPSWTRFIGEWM